jgi:hypothetical protein
MFSSSRKRGGADAFENDPSFMSKPTVHCTNISRSTHTFETCANIVQVLSFHRQPDCTRVLYSSILLLNLVLNLVVDLNLVSIYTPVRQPKISTLLPLDAAVGVKGHAFEATQVFHTAYLCLLIYTSISQIYFGFPHEARRSRLLEAMSKPTCMRQLYCSTSTCTM